MKQKSILKSQKYLSVIIIILLVMLGKVQTNFSQINNKSDSTSNNAKLVPLLEGDK